MQKLTASKLYSNEIKFSPPQFFVMIPNEQAMTFITNPESLFSLQLMNLE